MILAIWPSILLYLLIFYQAYWYWHCRFLYIWYFVIETCTSIGYLRPYYFNKTNNLCSVVTCVLVYHRAIVLGNVRLQIEQGSAVHHVRAVEINTISFYPVNSDQGHAYGTRSVWWAGSKYANPFPIKAGRSHFSLGMRLVPVKVVKDPHMRELLEAF